MRAVTYSRFGPAREVLQVQDVPIADPGPGEVRVDLQLSGVNPSDVKARAGSRPGVTEPAFPVIVPHSDGAGVISATGAGVSTARLGQPVWIWNGQWQRPFGTAAAQITLPDEQAVPLAPGTDAAVGASLGIPGLTAAHAVFGGGEVTGHTLLIQGGAGTVGLCAVQLARWGGATVIATARAEHAEEVRRAGAHHVLPYDAPDLAAEVLRLTGGQLIDRIIEVEFGLNVDTDAALIKPNGTIAAYGSAKQMAPQLSFGPLLFKAATIDVVLIYLLPPAQRAAAIERLNAALGAGALDIPVAQVFPLDSAAQAHEAVEAGARRGAILIGTTI